MKKQTADHPVTRDEIAVLIKDLDKKLSDRQYEMELRLNRQQFELYAKMVPIIIATVAITQGGIIAMMFKFFK